MASVHHGHSQGDLHDDESLLGDDLIEADDGECPLAGSLSIRVSCILSRSAKVPPMLQPSRQTTPYAIPPTQPLSEATLHQTPALELAAHRAMATT